MLRTWGCIHWAVLVVYSAAVFFLTRVSIALAVILLFIPIIATSMSCRYIQRDMVDYLHDHHPKEWGDIAVEMAYYRRNYHGLLYYDKGIKDPDYEELRNEYKRALWAFGFSMLASFATIIYANVASAHH